MMVVVDNEPIIKQFIYTAVSGTSQVAVCTKYCGSNAVAHVLLARHLFGNNIQTNSTYVYDGMRESHRLAVYVLHGNVYRHRQMDRQIVHYLQMFF